MTRNIVDVRKLIDRYVGIPLLFFLRLLNRCARTQQADKCSNEREVKNVLVIYLSGIGDTVMISSCLEPIAKRFPKAKISFLASSQNYGIVKENPHISQSLCLDKTRGLAGFAQSLGHVMRALRRSGYDIAIDFEQYLRLSAIISLLSRAKVSLGFKTNNQYRRHAYTHTLDFNPETHTLDNFFALLELLGIHHGIESMEEICVSEKDEACVGKLIDQCGISKDDMVVGIHPGSGGTALSRRWEPAKYAVIADLVISHYGAKILFTGTQDESQLVEEIRSGIKAKDACYNIAGKLTLAQFPSLIKRCCAFLSNDTGPVHIAAAMKVPVVALFGPNTPSRYSPVGEGHHVIYKSIDCSPCIIAHEGIVPYCKDNKCMQAISIEEVWTALKFLLGG